MRIQTIHPAVTVDGVTVQFAPTEDPGVYEGEVDDAIGQRLLDLAHARDYIAVPGAEPAPTAEPVEVKPEPSEPAEPQQGRRGRK